MQCKWVNNHDYYYKNCTVPKFKRAQVRGTEAWVRGAHTITVAFSVIQQCVSISKYKFVVVTALKRYSYWQSFLNVELRHQDIKHAVEQQLSTDTGNSFSKVLLRTLVAWTQNCLDTETKILRSYSTIKKNVKEVPSKTSVIWQMWAKVEPLHHECTTSIKFGRNEST